MYVKKKKEGYFENIEDIDSFEWKVPQKAKPGKDYIDKVDWNDVIVDQKLNGFACIAKKDGLFSFKGEQFLSAVHMEKALKEFFEENPDAYLQGEIFNPQFVNELNKIGELVSVTRGPKDITPELLAESEAMVQYHLYDGYGFNETTVNTVQSQRRKALCELVEQLNSPFIKLIEYRLDITSFDQMVEYFDQYVATGGEGVIIRKGSTPYLHKRTPNLLKWKKLEDDEFEVITAVEGKGKLAGKAGAAYCKTKSGEIFKVNIKGSMERVKEIWDNRDFYVGKKITGSYQELSPKGIPLQCYSDMVIRALVEG